MGNLNRYRTLILTVMAALITLTGCQKYEGLRLRYKTEKMYYKANRQAENILVASYNQVSARIDSIVVMFEDVIEFVDNHKGGIEGDEVRRMIRLSGLSKMRIAELYAADQRFEQAFHVYKEASINYQDDPEVVFNSSLQAANILRQIGDYRGALIEYESLFKEFPLTEFDTPPSTAYIEAPLQAAKLYLDMGDRRSFLDLLEKSRQFYRDGIDHYENRLDNPLPVVNKLKLQIAESYSAEGKFNDAIAVLNTISDPDGIRPAEVRLQVGLQYLDGLKDYDAAIREFSDIIADYPDSSVSARAQFGVGLACYNDKRYDEARSAFLKLEKNYPGIPALHSRGHWYFAKSFEDEGKWDRALVEYQYIAANFADSPEGIQVPLHIAEHYRQAKDRKAAAKAFEEAVESYKKLTQRFGNSPVATQASAQIAECYIRQEKWPEAVEALLETGSSFPRTYVGRAAFLEAAELAERKLQDREKAAEIYRTYIDTYPESRIKDELEQKIEQLTG